MLRSSCGRSRPPCRPRPARSIRRRRPVLPRAPARAPCPCTCRCPTQRRRDRVVPRLAQPRDELRPDKSGSADHNDVHLVPFRQSTSTHGLDVGSVCVCLRALRSGLKSLATSATRHGRGQVRSRRRLHPPGGGDTTATARMSTMRLRDERRTGSPPSRWPRMLARKPSMPCPRPLGTTLSTGWSSNRSSHRSDVEGRESADPSPPSDALVDSRVSHALGPLVVTLARAVENGLASD